MTTKPLAILTNADMGRAITLPDGTSGTLAGLIPHGDRVHVVLIAGGAYTTTEALAGDLVATITKEGG